MISQCIRIGVMKDIPFWTKLAGRCHLSHQPSTTAHCAMIRVNCHHHHHNHNHKKRQNYTLREQKRMVFDISSIVDKNIKFTTICIWLKNQLLLIQISNMKSENWNFRKKVKFDEKVKQSKAFWGQNGPFKAPWECQKGTRRGQNA